MQIRATTAQHAAWVEAMGWHNKKSLETLALIASEVGEAVDEAPDNKITAQFGSEVIDIVLRVIDLCNTQHVDIVAQCQAVFPNTWSSSINPDTATFSDVATQVYAMQTTQDSVVQLGRTPSVLESLALMLPDLARAMNDCRKAEVADTFGQHLTAVLLKALCLAHSNGVDVNATIKAKIEKNALSGNKGRLA